MPTLLAIIEKSFAYHVIGLNVFYKKMKRYLKTIVFNILDFSKYYVDRY